ncbi:MULTISPECIES: acyl-CoA dehydrogenase family protein [unclassified Sphingomonas]|uniref:acyl-CoA dehydrogenase family protein n=1 Tax=unclassified Sphingomonas TaxID=196159 RepID=UPI000700C795|nr:MULTISPECIES: acyl-CoA dehydrogenase family protein [unclassified Sphingomonas]KQX17607.1 pimeloyl-CoA dehydrogenase large subunit [Sphingomonas sp. Root1294]KQY70533.1 pimeloyl-CoA dehydrogenase large subunit [Sphingomonas sp. Root50]KRB91980.1 pimeloyl-CoA dehydrogenase large subunit [Sphingomonas sp. Root720]
MDLSFTEDERHFREAVRWTLVERVPRRIRDAVREEKPLPREWTVEAQRILNREGYAVPHWPLQWGGRDWSAVKRAILAEEIDRAGVPKPLPFNVALVGPVIAAFGSDEQKRRFLPPIANLDMWFCQGFSEPGAGSDLASLRMEAVREGDHYRVSGQKIWTTYAHKADWIFCLVRTGKGGRKHEGISFLLIDLATPGIEVRPIRTIDGYHHLNEVFFEDVRVPAENLVGEEGKGWDYARYLLGQERSSMGNVGFSRRRLDRAREIAGPLLDDPAWRRRLTWAEIELKALEITQMRVVANERPPSAGPDPKTSILKVKGGELLQVAAELQLDALGPEALTAGVPEGAGETLFQGLDARSAIVSAYFSSRKFSIFGGANEIQRNILAKAVLGLGKTA